MSLNAREQSASENYYLPSIVIAFLPVSCWNAGLDRLLVESNIAALMFLSYILMNSPIFHKHTVTVRVLAPAQCIFYQYFRASIVRSM